MMEAIVMVTIMVEEAVVEVESLSMFKISTGVDGPVIYSHTFCYVLLLKSLSNRCDSLNRRASS